MSDRLVTVQVQKMLYEAEWPQPDVDQAHIGKKYEAWVDLATVPIKAHSPRRMVVAEVLAAAGITPDQSKPALRVRVLDAESATVIEPEAYQPPAQWRVS